MFDRSLRRFAMTACCVAMLLSACSGSGAPQPSLSSAAPSIEATPALNPQDRALAIAKRITDLDREFLYSGKADLPEEMKTLVTTDVLAMQQADYDSVRSQKLTFKNVESMRQEFAPFGGQWPSGTAAAVHICSDYRQVETYRNGVFEQRGPLTYDRYFFKFEEDVLKLFSIKSEQVDACSLQ